MSELPENDTNNMQNVSSSIWGVSGLVHLSDQKVLSMCHSTVYHCIDENNNCYLYILINSRTSYCSVFKIPFWSYKFENLPTELHSVM